MLLSLCIVARDEAAVIDDAIRSAAGVVDETILVDTGSSDDTREIARSEGARVFTAPWPDHLGQAHDLPVAHARGRWVLVLDADEVLDPDRGPELRDLIAAGHADGYRLPVRNYTYGRLDARWRPVDARDPLVRGAAGHIPTTPVRLFRRDPAHRFSGALHQSVVPAIRAAGGQVSDAAVPIHHYGFLRFDRDKSALYPRLARRQVAARPDDPDAWIDLGILLVERLRLPDAADCFRRARRVGDSADAAFLLGSTVLDMDQPGAAVPLLHEALQAPKGVAKHFDPADAHDALGQAKEQLGRAEEAEAAYRVAAKAGKPGGMANLAGLLLDSERTEEAATLLEDALSRHRGMDVLWSLQGVAELRSGRPGAACAALQVALDIRPENLAARANLALAHRRAGRADAAAQAARAASEGVDSEEGRRLGIDRRLSSRHRTPSRREELPTGSGLVLSLIPALAGGGGRVLVDAVRALHDVGRPQVVACTTAVDYGGLALGRELAEMDVPVVALPSGGSLAGLLRRLRPSVVLQHWWRDARPGSPIRVGDARWVCIGHAPLPMPHGYDRWAVNSAYQQAMQGHLPEDRIVELPNGVDLQRFDAGPRGNRDPVTIAMLSRLDPGKFPRALPAYLPDLDGAKLRIAGSGARRHELEPELAAAGLTDRVEFVGPIPSVEVPGFLAEADIGLHLTELHRELCSMSILEMLASGLPVVAEPKGGLPEMVTDGVNGALATTPAAVAEHLRRLIGDGGLRHQMGEAGRGRAVAWDMATYGKRVRTLVEDVEGDDPVRLRSVGSVGQQQEAVVPRGPRLSYLVCSTPRSGSNLLCEALGNTGLAGHPEEFFAPGYETSLAGRHGADSLAAYLAWLHTTTITPNGAFGAKVMAGHLPRLIAGLRELTQMPGAAPAEVLAAALPGVQFVRIGRDDHLRQAISLFRAEQSGVWLASEQALHTPEPTFDRRAITQRMDWLAAQEKSWEEFFATTDVAPVMVTYEKLVADYEGTARRVLEQLGITVPPDLVFGPRHMVQQADELTEEWITRYHSETERLPPTEGPD